MPHSRHPAIPLAPWALAACLLWCPLAVQAAQFAPSALFLSKDAVMEGDTVLIHAVVQNNASDKFPGNLVIRDGDVQVGSVPVTLAANEVRAVSISWTPAPGSHKITAALLDSGGTAVQSESETFAVAAKPKPKPATAPKATEGEQTAAAVESSGGIQEQIGNLSPAVQETTAPVFTLIDSARSTAADVLDGQLANTKASLAKQPSPADVKAGEVKGAETIKTPDPMGSAWYVLYTLYFYILTVLRFIVGSAGVFYPLLAGLFLLFLWKMFRRFRRPSY